MASNTLRTVIGFLRSVAKRRLPFGKKDPDIQNIYNYLYIDNLYPTSGQPSESELEQIGKAGYETVINLAPTSMLENSVVREAEILEALGLEYVHIPVDFKAPTDDDFEKFVSSVEQAADGKVWVHCAANMRVSAFTYRYRLTVLNEDKAVAEQDLHEIWEPFGVWRKFAGLDD